MLEYHRGRARGNYRRYTQGYSVAVETGAGKSNVVKLISGPTSPGVKQIKSLWIKAVPSGRFTAGNVVGGWSGLLRVRSRAPVTTDLVINNPEILNPKPYIFALPYLANESIVEHYLKGVNIAQNEDLYWITYSTISSTAATWYLSTKWAQHETE